MVVQGFVVGGSIDVGLIGQGMVLVAVLVSIKICGVLVRMRPMQVERVNLCSCCSKSRSVKCCWSWTRTHNYGKNFASLM